MWLIELYGHFILSLFSAYCKTVEYKVETFFHTDSGGLKENLEPSKCAGFNIFKQTTQC